MLFWSRISNEAGESDVGVRGCVNGFIEPLLDYIEKGVKQLTILRIRLCLVRDLMYKIDN